MNGSFETSIEAIKHFARLDAARFHLRDSLRAQALVPLIKEYPAAFIEAGVIHYPLQNEFVPQIDIQSVHVHYMH
jgi:hypothetical protein